MLAIFVNLWHKYIKWPIEHDHVEGMILASQFIVNYSKWALHLKRKQPRLLKVIEILFLDETMILMNTLACKLFLNLKEKPPLSSAWEVTSRRIEISGKAKLIFWQKGYMVKNDESVKWYDEPKGKASYKKESTNALFFLITQLSQANSWVVPW